MTEDVDAKMKLTKRQNEILTAIVRSLECVGRPPTRAEICTEFGFKSPNAAETHLRALERKGAIFIDAHKSRGIQILREPAEIA